LQAYKKFILLISVHIYLTLGLAISASELTQAQINSIVVACQRTEYDYAIYRDRRDAEAFSQLFTENGEWYRSSGVIVKGRQAISEYITKLVKKGPELHMQLTTTIQVKPVDVTTALGVSYALVMETALTKESMPVTNGTFQVASESRSNYTLVNGECKISKREYTTIFVSKAKE